MEWRRMCDAWALLAMVMVCLGMPVRANDFSPASEEFLPTGDYLCTGATGGDLSLPSDFFSDNQIGSLWWLEGSDLANCWLEETHQRLELRSTSKSQWASARYASDDWGLDSTRDFSLKVDFHHAVTSGNLSWLAVSLVPDLADRDVQRITFGVASDNGYSYFWSEATDEAGTRSHVAGRSQSGGTLYLSYSAGLDELYLSYKGYGAANAWMTVRGFVQGVWASSRVTVALEGGSNLTQVDSGQAYFDSFVVATGSRTAPRLSEVYRFWSPVTEAHFYTISKAERDKLIKGYSDVWTFEGAAFEAAKTPFTSSLAPVYRFWSDVTQSHLYTISETEKDKLLREYKKVWTFEGIAFYAYPPGRQPHETKPVYRFWSPVKTAHFYTINESEKDKFLKEYRDIYIYEGVAFYAYEGRDDR
jgi:hypothetical protein